MNLDNHIIILKGLLTGVITGYLLVYGLRPAVQYPDFILDFFENKWVFLILLLVIYYTTIWDLKLGLLLFLSAIALIFDYVIFTNTDTKLQNTNNDIENDYPRFI